MSITHEAYLNIVPGDSPAPIIKVSQYDADFSIVFHLIAKKRGIVPAYPRTVDNDEDVTINVPTSATVSVRGTKTDGNGYSANATLSGTATAPIVTVAGHEQMTASAGINVYEITFYADDATKRLSTANFILFVEPAALDASTITSESLMLELNDLIASVPNAVAAADRAEAAVQSVEGVTTQVATNTQDISDIKADLSQIFSDNAKTALLACFANVQWLNGNGQDYYNALRTALGTKNPFENAEYGFGGYGIAFNTNNNTNCTERNDLTNRAGSVVPINQYGAGKLTAKSGYNVNAHFLTGLTYGPFEDTYGNQKEGYLDGLYMDTIHYQWDTEKTIPSEAKYVCVSIKKTNNADFTTSEIEHIYGTAFEYEEVE